LRGKYPYLDLEVDGGVGPNNIKECAEAGANAIISGTALMKNDNPADAVTFMKNKVDEVIRKSQLDR
jgi:ribulose-phosphate 3-epimerase